MQSTCEASRRRLALFAFKKIIVIQHVLREKYAFILDTEGVVE